MPPSPTAQAMFVAILVAIGGGLLGGGSAWGPLVFAVGLLGLAVWLLKQDIARRTVRNQGLTRFIAVCLLSGYAWLAIGAGVVLCVGGMAPGSRAYDAALHALRTGLRVLDGVRARPDHLPRGAAGRHARITAISMCRLRCSTFRFSCGLPATPRDSFEWTRAGGLFNAVALAAFVLGSLTAALRGRRERARPA